LNDLAEAVAIPLFSSPAETFEVHYGVNGRDGDGNVFQESNIVEFEKYVLQSTQNEGKAKL
jgi:hypothetical protein